MTQLTCSVVYCAHNLGGSLCNAAEIEINEDTRPGKEKTDCGTFIPRDFTGSLLSLDNVNYTGLVAQAFSGMKMVNPAVYCQVKTCHHHDDGGSCLAKIVEIQGNEALSSLETYCFSYKY